MIGEQFFRVGLAFSALMLGFSMPIARAQTAYDPGASQTEIKIGNTNPYSGPASSYGAIGLTQAAYFKMINEQGGINGRRINFISYDDSYSPPKTVEQTRKLVESDEVLLIFSPLGTPTSLATIAYLNAKKIPQLFIAAGGTMFGDYRKHPWSMAWQPSYQTESAIYAAFIKENYPQAKIAVLSANDDFGRDALKGLRDNLDAKSGGPAIVAEAAYESSDPTIDSQILRLKASGADIFVNFATPKFAAQAIRKIGEMNWKPVQIVHSVSQSIASVMKPAGLENAKGVISANYAKDPSDPIWKDDAGLKRWNDFMDKYMPEVKDRMSTNYVYGYSSAQTLAHTLKMAGDNLTRENVMKQATSLSIPSLDMVLPGVKVETSATDYFPLKQMQLQKFDGETWVRFGPVSSGAVKID